MNASYSRHMNVDSSGCSSGMFTEVVALLGIFRMNVYYSGCSTEILGYGRLIQCSTGIFLSTVVDARPRNLARASAKWDVLGSLRHQRIQIKYGSGKKAMYFHGCNFVYQLFIYYFRLNMTKASKLLIV